MKLRHVTTMCLVSLLVACPGETVVPDDSVTAEDVAGDVTVDVTTDVVEDVSVERMDLTWPVGEAGPYGAGHRTVEMGYEAVSTGQTRSLVIHLWYPTEATEGEEAVYMSFFTDEGTWEGAPLAAPAVGETYPLHVHSHGHLGYAGSSPYLMRHFATHGWVVAAPDHQGNTILDNIDPRPAWMYAARLEDISATLDHLAELDPSDPLAGAVDPTRALLSGHSFGGYTSLGLAGAAYDADKAADICAAEPDGVCTEAVQAHFDDGYLEPRFVGAIPMAPGNYGIFGPGIASTQTPIMHMTGSDDRPQDNEDIWAALPESSVRVHVEGGCHQLFALGGCELISDEDGLPIINAYALAFGRRLVLDDEGVAGLLDGTEDFHEAVTYSVK